jgi:multiple sugar transport system substrate-binding protein
MLKRNRILVVVILLLISIIVGCGKGNGNNTGSPSTNSASEGGSTEKTSGEKVNLRYLMFDFGPTYQKIIDEFEKDNPNIKVELQVVPWANFFDKLNTDIAGGTGPDMFGMPLQRFPTYLANGSMLDIKPYVDRDKIDLSQYHQDTVKRYTSDGKLYSIPQYWASLAMIYNKDLLKKAGYDEYPKDLSWNVQDGGSLVKFLQDLTLDKNGKHPYDEGFDHKNIIQYGFTFIDKDQVDPGQLISFAGSNGGTIIKDDKLALDQKLEEVYQFIYDLSFKYYVSPTYTDIRTGGSEVKFIGQQIAVWYNGNWLMKGINEKASFEWGIAPSPAGPAGKTSLIIGEGSVINAKTKHPEEAWKLLSYFTSKKAQDIFASAGLHFPAYADSLPGFIDTYNKLGIDASAFIEQFKGNSVPAPTATNYNDWYNVFVKYTSLMLSGEIDPKTTLQKIQQEGDAVAGKK